MKVYLGYQCYYDYCDIWESVAKVFDDELKAIDDDVVIIPHFYLICF